MEETALRRASIATKSNALMRKNLVIQKNNMVSTLVLLLWPVLACLGFHLLDKQLKALKELTQEPCPTEIMNFDTSCSFPRPAKMPALFEVPAPQSRATRGENTSDPTYYPDLPRSACKKRGFCPVSILLTGENRSLAEGLGQILYGSETFKDGAQDNASALEIASIFMLGTPVRAKENYLMETAFDPKHRLFVVQPRCKRGFGLSVGVQVNFGEGNYDGVVKCARGIQLWREDSRKIIREIAMSTTKKDHHFMGAYDFSNTDPSKFNVTIWLTSGSAYRSPRYTNVASNSYLQFLRGSKVQKVQMVLEFVKEMPNSYGLKHLNPVGALFRIGQLMVVLGVIHSLIPFLMINIIYEKQNNLRMIMKMHGLEDAPYWIITYAYLLITSTAYVLLLLIFGSILGLDIIALNDYSIQLVFYFTCINLQIAFILLLSTLFSKVKTASVFANSFVVISLFVELALLFSLSKLNLSSIWFLKFIPNFVIFIGVYLLGEYEAESKELGAPRMGWKDIGAENLKEGGMLSILLTMLLEWAICLLFAFYLDQVGSNGSGVRKHPLWFLPCFRGGSRRKQSEGYDVLVNMEKPDVSQEREKVERLVRESSQNQYAVICDNLKKMFPAKDGNPVKYAVKGLSLALPKGECLGMLGPNGAGKTTFISMMTGLTSPSSGTALVQGLDITEDMDIVYAQMGVCPQHDLLWEVLTGREHLCFYGRLKNLKGDALKQAVEDSLKNVNLLEKGDLKAGKYSGGMKRRLSVAISLIGNPIAAYLDEPSTGLDPASKKALWMTVKNAKKDKAIILTTHSMEEAEFLCDRVGIFVDGSLQCIGNPKELRARFGGYFLMTITTPSDQSEEVEKLVTTLSPTADKIYHIAGTQKYHLQKEEVRLADVFKAVENASSRLKVQDWGLADATLEDVFITVASGAESIY